MAKTKVVTNSDGSAFYEEAVALTGYGKFNYLVTAVGGFSLMISLMATVDVTYVLPSSECELKLEKEDRGVLSGAYFIGVVVSSHLLGFLSDTLGRRYILVRALFTNIIIYIVASFSLNYWWLLKTRFLTGVVLCGVLTCGLVYVGEFHSNKYRTRAVMFTATLANLAFIYCACFGWLILPSQWYIPLFGIFTLTPWRIYYLMLGVVPSLIIGSIMFFLPESPKYLLACSKQAEALEVLQKVYKFNTGNAKEQYPVKNLLLNPNEQVSQLTGRSKSLGAVFRFIWNQTYPLFMPPHVLNMLFSCVILFSLFYSLSGVLIWIPEIMNQLIIIKDNPTAVPVKFCHIVESNWTANLERSDTLATPTPVDVTGCRNTLKTSMFELNTLIGAVLIAVLFVATFILPKVNRKVFVSIVCFSIIAIYFVLIYFTNVYVMIACLAAIIVLLNIIFCGTTTLLVDYFPTNFRAMAVCLAIMTGRLGSAVGGDIFSLFLLHHCTTMFYIAGALLLLSGLSCLSLTPPKVNRVTASPNPVATIT